jgi:hypothetical protein
MPCSLLIRQLLCIARKAQKASLAFMSQPHLFRCARVVKIVSFPRSSSIIIDHQVSGVAPVLFLRVIVHVLECRSMCPPTDDHFPSLHADDRLRRGVK